MAESDFSRPCIIGYGSSPSRYGPAAVAERSIARAPGSRAKSVCTCQVLRPRRIDQALAILRLFVLPSALETASGQCDDGDVGRYDEACRHVPAGLVDQEDSVGGGCNGRGDLRELQVHRFGIAGRQDQGCALAPLRAYRTEDVGGGGTPGTRCALASAALRPATVILVLLADASLVGEPDFYRVAVERLRAPDFFQAHWGAFLKSSIAPCACAWWRGRAESLR